MYCLGLNSLALQDEVQGRRNGKRKSNSESGGHCLAGVCTYYSPSKYLILAASVMRSQQLTACTL
jgi:hypothetical protein